MNSPFFAFDGFAKGFDGAFAPFPGFDASAFARAQQAQLDGMLAFSNTLLASAEQLAALNLDAARSLLDDGSKLSQSLLTAKDLPDYISIQSQFAQPAADKANAWSKRLLELGSATQTELGKALETGLQEGKATLDATLAQIEKAAPAGMEPAISASVAAFKSALSAATSAYESVCQTADRPTDKPAGKARKAA